MLYLKLAHTYPSEPCEGARVGMGWLGQYGSLVVLVELGGCGRRERNRSQLPYLLFQTLCLSAPEPFWGGLRCSYWRRTQIGRREFWERFALTGLQDFTLFRLDEEKKST
ncbi:MAG: hypothetical protein NT023_14030 [Armatimonadetes bacterium]|nr:hypothetical protein [Armatimonadota bacterium]